MTAKTRKTARTEKTEAASATAETIADFPAFEVPGNVRELAEKSVDQAKVVYGHFRDAAQDTVDMLDDSASAFKDGSAGFHMKAVDFAQANADAGFDFARKLIEARDIGEVLELQVDFARDRVQVLIGQARELGAITTGVAEKAVQPLRDGMTRSVAQAKSAFNV